MTTIVHRYALPRLALAAILLALGAVLLLSSQPAEASSHCDGTEIWCETLTSANVPGGGFDDVYGYGDGSRYGSGGTLSPNTFDYDGTTYTIKNLVYVVQDLYPGVVGYDVVLELDRDFPSGITHLYANGTAYALDDPTAGQATGLIVWYPDQLPWGETATVQVELVGVPGAPQNLTATAGHGQVKLDWTAGAGGGSASTTHQYRQKEGTGEFGEWMDIPASGAGGANATSYTVTDLTNGTAYVFKVRAVNALGDSNASNEVETSPILLPAGCDGTEVWCAILTVGTNTTLVGTTPVTFTGYSEPLEIGSISSDGISHAGVIRTVVAFIAKENDDPTKPILILNGGYLPQDEGLVLNIAGAEFSLADAETSQAGLYYQYTLQPNSDFGWADGDIVLVRLIETHYARITSVDITSDPLADPASDTYRGNDEIEVTATFSNPVGFDASEGSPSIDLKIGDETRQAVYHSGGAAKLTVADVSPSDALETRFGYAIRDRTTDVEVTAGGSLSRTTFTIGGTTYTIEGIFWDSSLVRSYLWLDPAPGTTTTADWRLHIGGVAYPFSDADHTIPGVFVWDVDWDWSVGDATAVGLTGGASNAPLRELVFRYTVSLSDIYSWRFSAPPEGVEYPHGTPPGPVVHDYDADGIEVLVNSLRGAITPIYASTGLAHTGLFDQPGHKVEGIRPVASPYVEGDKLRIRFDEDLDESSVPANGDFTVKVGGKTETVHSESVNTGGTVRDVTGVSVAGNTVTLTLASEVDEAVPVTVSYEPGANPIRDLTGNPAAPYLNDGLTEPGYVPDKPVMNNHGGCPGGTAGVIWCATMTVGEWKENRDAPLRAGVQLGFRDEVPTGFVGDDIGYLDLVDTYFTAGGMDRSVKGLYIETVTNNYITGLRLVVSGEEDLPGDFKEDLSLIVGGREFTFAGNGDAGSGDVSNGENALEFSQDGNPVYAWYSHHIWWHRGQKVVVKLVNEEALRAMGQQAETPLTASWENVPEGHDGETPLAFRLAFSEAIGISYRTLRDHSLEVTGGEVSRARRVDGRSDLWEITVKPDSEADLSILLPPTTDCADLGAVCAGSDKPLSGGLALLIPFSSALKGPPPNRASTGAPTILGSPNVGETLSANTSEIGDEDGLFRAVFIYQWVSNDGNADADMQDATGSTYTLASGDEGKTIKVRVSFTDDADNQESLTSAATAEIGPPLLTARFEDAAESHNGETHFNFNIAFSEPIGISFRTLRDHSLEVTGGSVIRARRIDGRHDLWKIAVNPDSDADVTVVLPVTLDCEDRGAVCTSGGKMLSRRVELNVPGPEEPGQNSPATGLLTIDGTAQVGKTLTANTDAIEDADGLDNPAYTYQWLANNGTTDTDISGAINSTYTSVEADEGKAIRVRVTFTDDANNDETLTSDATDAVEAKPNSPATGLPTISGTLRVGETLTANTGDIEDADGIDESTYTYQWLADDGNGDTDISGATGNSYTLVSADEGKTIRVRVTFTDDADNQETLTSEATAAVEAKPNSPATGLPTISGTLRVGETLTAVTTGIEDADGIDESTYTYQWLADDVEIAGATGLNLHPGLSRRGQDHQGPGELHRRRGQPGDSDQRCDGGGGGQAGGRRRGRGRRHLDIGADSEAFWQSWRSAVRLRHLL